MNIYEANVAKAKTIVNTCKDSFKNTQIIYSPKGKNLLKEADKGDSFFLLTDIELDTSKKILKSVQNDFHTRLLNNKEIIKALGRIEAIAKEIVQLFG